MAEMVVIKCRSPQVNGKGESVCVGTRRVLPQDVHQVKRCVPCQRQSTQNYRNAKAKAQRWAARLTSGDVRSAQVAIRKQRGLPGFTP